MQNIYREKKAEDEAAGQEEKMKAKEEVRGCSEGRHVRCYRGRCREQSEMEKSDQSL